MHRSRFFRRFGFVASLVIIAGIVAGPAPSFTSLAQEGTPEPVSSPAASPVGSPVAQSAAVPSVFISGQFRIEVVTARAGDAIPEFNLRARAGKVWIVVVADATNWSSKLGTLAIRDFGIRLTGGGDPRGLAARTTENLAAVLGAEPKATNAGVKIAKGQTIRIVLGFQINADGANPALAHDGQALPLASSLAAQRDLLALPAPAPPPALEVAQVDDVVDGATLTLTGGHSARLAELDPPKPEECFGGQSASRLKKLAGDEVLLETTSDGSAYVWAEQSNGSRRLLNYEMLTAGFAALLPGTAGPFNDWLTDAEGLAKSTLAGVWGSCTSVHGVARNEGPERAVLAVRSGDTNRDYEIWGVVSWAPTVVTTPDGGAWAFFSARAKEGPDAGKGRLYGAHYDPSAGAWQPATPLPGGDVEFGPTAVVDSRGLVHLIYSDRTADSPEVFSVLTYIHEDGFGGWTEPVAVAADPNAGHQIAADLAIDKNDTLHVVWQDQRSFSAEARQASALNADIFASDLPPGGQWSAPVRVNPHLPTAAGARPRIVADGDRLVAVWSVYTSATGPTNAARLDWSTRPLETPEGWTLAQPLVVGRGETFGGRGLDLAADPNGGAIMVYTRQVNDTFLFARRLAADSDQWGGDVLITAGNRGTYPTVTINAQGVVFIAYNVGTGDVVDVGAVAIPFRSIQPGPETLLTQDDPNTQGIPVLTTDVTGSPWLVYFSEIPRQTPNKTYVLRNAVIPTT